MRIPSSLITRNSEFSCSFSAVKTPRVYRTLKMFLESPQRQLILLIFLNKPARLSNFCPGPFLPRALGAPREQSCSLANSLLIPSIANFSLPPSWGETIHNLSFIPHFSFLTFPLLASFLPPPPAQTSFFRSFLPCMTDDFRQTDPPDCVVPSNPFPSFTEHLLNLSSSDRHPNLSRDLSPP